MKRKAGKELLNGRDRRGPVRSLGKQGGDSSTRDLQRARKQARQPDGLVKMSAIRRLAREIADKFDPEEIVLFGSYAYGKPDAGSDVDVLVVMPARNDLDQAVRISEGVARTSIPFPLDLIVRTPRQMKCRLREGDWFLREIMCKGKVLYAKPDAPVGRTGRRGIYYRHRHRPRKAATE